MFSLLSKWLLVRQIRERKDGIASLVSFVAAAKR
jgi:hypothetical protein